METTRENPPHRARQNGIETSVAVMDVLSAFSGVKRTMERDKVKEIFQRLNSGGVRYALIGGLAYSQYAPPRATQDVDLIVHAGDIAKVRQLFPGCYRGGTAMAEIYEHEGTRFDVQPARRRTQLGVITRAAGGSFEGEALKVATVRDLLFLKLWASVERPEELKKDRDRVDIADLLVHNAERVSPPDMAAIAGDLLEMAYTAEEHRKFREALEWLNRTLDRLGMSDRKVALE